MRKLNTFLNCLLISSLLLIAGIVIGQIERGYSALGGELMLAGIPFLVTYVVKPMFASKEDWFPDSITEKKEADRIRRETAVNKIHTVMEEYRFSKFA